MMSDDEKRRTYQFIAEQHEQDCLGISAEKVEEIHQGLIRNTVKGVLSESCIILVIDDLRAQGLGGQ